MALPLSAHRLVFEACRFAAATHRDQRRKDRHGSPYINHPIEAAHLLSTVGGVSDPAILVATLLKDVLTGTATSPRELERLFGPEVRRFVEEVTDTPGVPGHEQRRQQLDRVRTASTGARLIRLAAKVAALDAPPHDWDESQRLRYLRWVGDVGAALKGTNARLEALLAERLREAWTRAHQTPSPDPPPRPTVPRTVAVREAEADLSKAFARLQSRLSDAEELADVIASMLNTLGIESKPLAPPPGKGSTTHPAKTPPPRPPRFNDQKWRKIAEPGVGTLKTRQITPRTIAVSIDGAPEFELTFTLGTLLRILASGAGQERDGFPPFLSYEEIAAQLRAATGRPAGVRAVAVGISRLRGQLLSPLLAETAPGQKARFRIRRAKA